MANITTSFHSLDSIFTPGPGCLAPTFSIPPLGNDAIANYAPESDVESLIRGTATQCYPDGFANQTTTTISDGLPTEVQATSIIYTPARCPSGYVSATGSERSSYSYAICCPSNMTLSVRTASSDTPCVSWMQTGGPPATVLYVSEILTITSSISYFASPITVANRLGEPTASATSTALGSSGPTQQSSGSSTGRDSGGLSKGSSIGIGVGVGVGVLAIATILFLLWWIRRRHKRNQGPDMTEDNAATYLGGKAELPGDGKEPQLNEMNHDKNALHEAEGAGQPPEADAANVRAELEGDWHGWEAPVKPQSGQD